MSDNRGAPFAPAEQLIHDGSAVAGAPSVGSEGFTIMTAMLRADADEFIVRGWTFAGVRQAIVHAEPSLPDSWPRLKTVGEDGRGGAGGLTRILAVLHAAMP
jgi:hypothetical protein